MKQQAEKMTAKAILSSDNRLQQVIWFVAALIFAYGVYRVTTLAWIGDDAFISFRYAKNFVNGLGLVFNVGERVEGYTNFLWTLVIAGGLKLGLDPVPLSQWLGGLSFFTTVGLFGYLSVRMGREIAGGSRLVIPLTSLALLLHREMQVYATSGLETAFLTTLVSAGFLLLVLGRSPRAALWAGLALVAAAMARPDAMLFLVMAIPFVALQKEGRWSRLAWYLAPLMVIYLPYWFWRFSYYGYPFPNTYYAKSGDLAYYSQGWKYVWLYFKSYYILLLSPLALLGLAGCVAGMRKIDKIMGSLHGRLSLLILLFVIPYLFYVIRVGGDFMFGRFLIPITPLLFLSLELSLPAVARSARTGLVAAGAVVLAVALHWHPFDPPNSLVDGIADEHHYYPNEWHERAREVGARLREDFEGINCTVGFYGMFAMHMYYAEFPVAIECNAGLTDEFSAHQKLTKRGRVGHEKSAPPEYMFRRQIRFIFRGGVRAKTPYDQMRIIRFGDFNAYILTYDNTVMEKLRRRPGIEFIAVPSFLDDYLKTIDQIPLTRRQQDFGFFREYYFMNNSDSSRYAQFTKALGN